MSTDVPFRVSLARIEIADGVGESRLRKRLFCERLEQTGQEKMEANVFTCGFSAGGHLKMMHGGGFSFGLPSASRMCRN